MKKSVLLIKTEAKVTFRISFFCMYIQLWVHIFPSLLFVTFVTKKNHLVLDFFYLKPLFDNYTLRI